MFLCISIFVEIQNCFLEASYKYQLNITSFTITAFSFLLIVEINRMEQNILGNFYSIF